MSFMNNEHFVFDFFQGKECLQISCTLLENENRSSYPVQCLYLKTESASKLEDVCYDVIDYLDLYWRDFFHEDRDVFLPLDWGAHEFEGHKFYMRGFIRRLDLEQQAEELFSKHGFGGYEIQPISSDY